jgi:hypothetical protein
VTDSGTRRHLHVKNVLPLQTAHCLTMVASASFGYQGLINFIAAALSIVVVAGLINFLAAARSMIDVVCFTDMREQLHAVVLDAFH